MLTQEASQFLDSDQGLESFEIVGQSPNLVVLCSHPPCPPVLPAPANRGFIPNIGTGRPAPGPPVCFGPRCCSRTLVRPSTRSRSHGAGQEELTLASIPPCFADPPGLCTQARRSAASHGLLLGCREASPPATPSDGDAGRAPGSGGAWLTEEAPRPGGRPLSPPREPA